LHVLPHYLMKHWSLKTSDFNDKSQGNVATYLRRGGVVNNQITKGLLLSVPVKQFLNRWIFGKVTSKKVVVSCTFFVFYSSALVRRTKCTRHKTFLLVTFPNIHRFGKKLLTDSAINFLPPCLKYFATLPCNFSLIACFLASMFHKAVWQNMQSVVRLLIILLRWKLTKESIFQWKKNCKSVKIWQYYGHEFGVSTFWPIVH